MQGSIPPFHPNTATGEQEPAVESMSWRRSGHGSSARLQRPAEMRLRQPQDGATDVTSRVASLRSPGLELTGEPEDARLTGGTRSLMRRVLGLNVMAPPLPAALPAASALPAQRRAPRNLKPPQSQVA
jgi:hypothetical protein